jgi:hypothetical protein
MQGADLTIQYKYGKGTSSRGYPNIDDKWLVLYAQHGVSSFLGLEVIIRLAKSCSWPAIFMVVLTLDVNIRLDYGEEVP